MNLNPNAIAQLHLGQLNLPSVGRRALFSALAGGATAAISAPQTAAAAVNLADTGKRLETLVRATGDTSGKQSVLWSHGAVFAWIPGQGGYHLFDLDFVSVRRWERMDNGWRRLSKEAGLYLDKHTGEVLDRWSNPFIQRDVEVMHILNDPFIRDHVPADAGGTWAVDYWKHDASVLLYRSVLLSRKPDLTPEDYPLYAQANSYDFGEFYSNLLDRADVDDVSKTSIPVITVNTRVGNWVPWMEMGQRQGWQINQLRGKKLDRVEQLPRTTLNWLERNAPGMLEAPTRISGENVNSFKAFKAKLAADKARKEGLAP